MSRTVRTPDAFTRVAAAGVVPAVAIAAHGAAGGPAPDSRGLVLTAAIGVVAAMFLQLATQRRRLFPATASAVGILTAAQVASHWSLASGHGAHADSGAHLAPGAAALPMLLTHLVAIPLSAGLIVVGAQLLAVVGSVIASLTPPAVLRAPAARPVFWTQPGVLAGPAVGGTGVRGPPLGF